MCVSLRIEHTVFCMLNRCSAIELCASLPFTFILSQGLAEAPKPVAQPDLELVISSFSFTSVRDHKPELHRSSSHFFPMDVILSSRGISEIN